MFVLAVVLSQSYRCWKIICYVIKKKNYMLLLLLSFFYKIENDVLDLQAKPFFLLQFEPT